MADCCGGAAASALMAAKRMLDGSPLPPADPEPVAANDNGYVKMEFIGSEMGAITINGTGGGRAYRGANNSTNRFALVHPADVEKLESTGKWARVKAPVQAQASPAQAAPAPFVPAKSAEELRQEAVRALEQAKADLGDINEMLDAPLTASIPDLDPLAVTQPQEKAKEAVSEQPVETPAAKAPASPAPTGKRSARRK